MSIVPVAIKNITPFELKELLRQDMPPLIIDVREREELEICALPEFIHIPLGDLTDRINTLPPNRLIVTLCHHGRRSLQAACFLKNHGFDKVMNLAGGIHLWASQVDPAMPQY